MVVINDLKVVSKMWIICNYGVFSKYVYEELGINSRLDIL